MAARTSSRICRLSWSSGNKHRCAGRSPGCLWQHEGDGDSYASLGQPGKAEYPGGEQGPAVGSSSDPSQQCRALWPLTGRAGASLYVACGVRLLRVMSVGAVRPACCNCTSSSHPRERAQLAGPAGDGSRHWPQPRGYFPRATVLTATHRLEMAFSFPCPNFHLPVHPPSTVSPVPAHTSGPLQPLPPRVWAPAPPATVCPLSLSPWGAIGEASAQPPLGQSHRQGSGLKATSLRGEAVACGNQRSGLEARRLLLHVGLGQQRDPDQTLSLLTGGWKGSSRPAH